MTKALLIGCILLTGCATGYQSGKFSLTGGYFEQPINDGLQKVVFYANGYTGIETATRYALFRCAEVANEKKKPYFIMYPSLNAAALDRPSRRPNSGIVGMKPAAFAFLALSDVAVPGATETSKVMSDLEQFRAEYREAMAAKGSSKKKTTPKN